MFVGWICRHPQAGAPSSRSQLSPSFSGSNTRVTSPPRRKVLNGPICCLSSSVSAEQRIAIDLLADPTIVAGIIADAIRAVFEDSSVSEIFDGQNQS